jgi:predicted O-methyltransferase YrrM
MNRLLISENSLSEIFWTRLLTSSDIGRARREALIIAEETKIVHQRFPSDTAGSISLNTTVLLWLVAKYFGPQHIFEIGTFIGRSGLALLAGSSDTIKRVDTCDFSFDQFYLTERLKTTFPNYSKLNYWPKTSSSVALKQILDNGGLPDLFFVDGRIGKEDLALISQIKRKSTIFVLDDFEGTEKGVENCLILRRTFPELILIRPHLAEGAVPANTALLLHPALISLTRQQDLPIPMQ